MPLPTASPVSLAAFSTFFFLSAIHIAFVAAVVLFILAYFGFFGLSLSTLKNNATLYDPIVYQYDALIIGILLVSIGFVIGVIIGFILG